VGTTRTHELANAALAAVLAHPEHQPGDQVAVVITPAGTERTGIRHDGHGGHQAAASALARAIVDLLDDDAITAAAARYAGPVPPARDGYPVAPGG
jgi:hypothetical protein